MKLPGKLSSLFAKDKQEKNLFFAVLFEQTRLTAAVFLSRTDDTEITTFRSAPFSGSVIDSINVLDRLLTELADEDLRAEEVENTIFGFPNEFLADGEIKENIKNQLKELVEKLSLIPCGYVVISEALAYYLSSQAGAQESAIFVGVAESEIHVSLVKIGNIIEEKTTARTDNICSDLENVLNSFQQEVLPAKIVLYDNTYDLTQVKDELLDYPWEDKCNFLHFPKIELLPETATLQAVISAYTKHEAKMVYESKFEQTKREKFEEQEETEQPYEKDVSFQKEIEKEPEQIYQEELKVKKRFPLPKFKFKLPKFSLRFSKKYLFIGAILLLLIGGGIGLTRFYTPSAQVRILVDQDTHEKKLEFTLDPEAESVNLEEKIIPGEKVSVTLEGEATKETTGTELVGEAAEGTVTIYNKTTNTKTFPAGTILIAGNNLKFSLNDKVKVASSSEEVGGLIYGKKEAGVKAETIGPDGNISSDSELIFEDYPKDEYSARAKEDFSGGTSREISVVAEDDVVSLRKKIVTNLKSEAKKKLSEQKGGDLTLLDDTLEGDFVKEVLSDKIGEQAKEVSLKGEVSFTALAYNREDISKLLQKNAEEEMREGYEIKDGVVGQRILDQEINEDGSVSFTAAFTITLLPKLNTENLRSKLAGKPLSENKLKEAAGDAKIGEIEVVFDKKIPFINPQKLPSNPEKLQIIILPR